MNLKKLVVIPTYNEIENIEAIITAVFQLANDFHVLVVDDNSPDGTFQQVKKMQREYPQLFLEVRPKKNGLGAAYVHGFQWAIANKYDYVFEMDADFSHNPKDLIRMFDTAVNEQMDLVIGSRYINGVNVVNWPLSRVLLSYFASFYVKIITGMKIHDATAGFKCYHIDVLKSINLNSIKFVGYAFQIEMKYRTYVKGFKIKEIPIIFTDRANGVSKMSSKIINEAVFGVVYLRFKQLFSKL